MHRKCISSWTQKPPRSLSTHRQCAVESTPEVTGFPALSQLCYFLTKLWQPHSAAGLGTTAGRQGNSTAAHKQQLSALSQRRGVGEGESENISCSGTETWVQENHSPLKFTLHSEGSHSALQTRTSGSFLLSL